MNVSLKIFLIKLILVNLVPIIGVIFLEWELFEIGITYILETCAIYLVYELDHYFIDKKTRIPIIMALLQLFFTSLTFGAMMYGSAMIMYIIITPQTGEYNDFIDHFFTKLDRMQIVFPAVAMFVLEIISFYVRKSKDATHTANNTWRIIRRILYSHLYMVVCLIVFSVLPQNMYVMIPFFIGLKIILEYSVEDEKIYRNIGNWISERRLQMQFKGHSKNNSTPAGYLSKKSTYSRRNKRK